MQPYENITGESGISAFEMGEDYIDIEFANDHSCYRYDYHVPGQRHVELMKMLATSGRGLNTYINARVRDRYAKRLK